MASLFDSKKLNEVAKALRPGAKPLLLIFPDMELNLKKAGYDMSALQYLAIILFMSLTMFIFSSIVIVLFFMLMKTGNDPYIMASIPFIASISTFLYFFFMPKLKIMKDARQIDKNLEYMLKDMQIQLTAGVPLFNAIANVGVGGYGKCSEIANEIVQEVESGSSMQDVLHIYGMLSPSDGLKRALWQISNAMQTGSDVKTALVAISDDIRREKENKIKVYGQELSLWALVYMMMVIVMPSMGVTLLLVLSSFVGARTVNEDVFWMILMVVIIIQLMFISMIRGKRPDV